MEACDEAPMRMLVVRVGVGRVRERFKRGKLIRTQ